jgi:hypothetical protein
MAVGVPAFPQYMSRAQRAGISICQPECQFGQSYNEDCNAKDGKLSKNKVWSLGRANFD